MHISSSYSEIWGETNFHTREFPRSGPKAKNGEKEKREEKTPENHVGGNKFSASGVSRSGSKAKDREIERRERE